MQQKDQAGSKQFSGESDATSFPFPERFIPWIPLMALVIFLMDVSIFFAVIVPRAEIGEVATAAQGSIASGPAAASLVGLRPAAPGEGPATGESRAPSPARRLRSADAAIAAGGLA